jgi:UDPglucose 6-dehydrogenase
VHQMKVLGIDPLLLAGVEAANTRQRKVFAQRILDVLKGTPNPVVALWGLAFKSDTDDIREAPALDILNALLEAGVTIKAFDPQAMDNVRKFLGSKASKVQFCTGVEEATQGADAVALVTEWNEFITQNWHHVAALMRGKHIFDGRNCLASGKVAAAGLHYYAIGRPPVRPGEGKQGTMGVVSAG